MAHDLISPCDRFPRPDWEQIDAVVKGAPLEQDTSAAWYQVVREWLLSTAKVLGDQYKIFECEHFFLLSSEEPRYVELFLGFLTRTRKKILRRLGGIARDSSAGKVAVIIFDSQDQYYEYISYFYPPGKVHSISSGVFVREGCGHLVFPHQQLGRAEPIATHELTHALLSHLPIPLWLNEGLALILTEAINGVNPFWFDNTMLERHSQFWDRERIQAFWYGQSFTSDDETRMSYELAYLVVRALAQGYDTFAQFVLGANERDGGEDSAKTHLGMSLGQLIVPLIGEGDWGPKHMPV